MQGNGYLSNYHVKTNKVLKKQLVTALFFVSLNNIV